MERRRELPAGPSGALFLKGGGLRQGGRSRARGGSAHHLRREDAQGVCRGRERYMVIGWEDLWTEELEREKKTRTYFHSS